MKGSRSCLVRVYLILRVSPDTFTLFIEIEPSANKRKMQVSRLDLTKPPIRRSPTLPEDVIRLILFFLVFSPSLSIPTPEPISFLLVSPQFYRLSLPFLHTHITLRTARAFRTFFLPDQGWWEIAAKKVKLMSYVESISLIGTKELDREDVETAVQMLVKLRTFTHVAMFPRLKEIACDSSSVYMGDLQEAMTNDGASRQSFLTFFSHRYLLPITLTYLIARLKRITSLATPVGHQHFPFSLPRDTPSPASPSITLRITEAELRRAIRHYSPHSGFKQFPFVTRIELLVQSFMPLCDPNDSPDYWNKFQQEMLIGARQRFPAAQVVVFVSMGQQFDEGIKQCVRFLEGDERFREMVEAEMAGPEAGVKQDMRESGNQGIARWANDTGRKEASPDEYC